MSAGIPSWPHKQETKSREELEAAQVSRSHDLDIPRLSSRICPRFLASPSLSGLVRDKYEKRGALSQPGDADTTTGMPKAHCRPPNSGHPGQQLWFVCASVIGGFIKRLLMKVTHTEGQAAQDAGLRGEEMRLLKRVMRDRTNPQYRPTLSLNPLMIGAFSLVCRTVCYKPLWPGGMGGG